MNFYFFLPLCSNVVDFLSKSTIFCIYVLLCLNFETNLLQYIHKAMSYIAAKQKLWIHHSCFLFH